MNKIIVGVLVVLTLAVGYLFVSQNGMLGAASGPSHFQKESFLQGLAAGVRDQFSISNVGALITSAVSSFNALVTLNAGTLHSSPNSTSTPASMTMKASDVNGYETVIVTPTGAASAKTLTFFASSTASTWLPTAGDMQRTCFLNATTTAGVNLVFAAGTGIDLQIASSTTMGAETGLDLTIAPNATGCFTFIRKAATSAAFDIEANLLEYGDAD